MSWRLPRIRVLFTAIVFLCLYAPIVLVVVFSVNKDPQLLHWEGFTLHWYKQAFHDEAVRRTRQFAFGLAWGDWAVAAASLALFCVLLAMLKLFS